MRKIQQNFQYFILKKNVAKFFKHNVNLCKLLRNRAEFLILSEIEENLAKIR